MRMCQYPTPTPTSQLISIFKESNVYQNDTT